MLRKEKIYMHLKHLCKKIKHNEKIENIGFSADFIAQNLDMVRSNVSSDLNKLYKEGRIFKIEGRPTLYLDKEWVRQHNYCDDKLEDKDKRYTAKKEIIDCFSKLIGYDGSLASQIKQAEAAILYPPHGLCVLILGETGTGKTMFADYMYRFASENSIVKKDAPFITFNCADYANNRELLMAILFGSAKGSYTGSETNKCGLVEEADEGILFLDEVHRLPPEGQEMLFTLMDKGKFRRLGDTAERKADVFIIAATTESPESTFLKTFYRRFPIVIRMPSLKERSVKERLMLISYFFNKESMRIKMPIKVSSDVLTALAMYLPPANVGDIKSAIELIVSKGYMDYLINRDSIRIVLSYLPESIKNMLLYNKSKRHLLAGIIGYEDKLFIEENLHDFDMNYKNDKFSNDIYVYLDKKFEEYKSMNIEKEKMKDTLYKDLEEYFLDYNRRLISKGLDESKLSKFVDNKIINILKLICSEVETKFNYYINQNTFVALAFHINSMQKRRVQSSSVNLLGIKEKHPKEYDIATYIHTRLCSVLQYKITKNEIEFICILLHLTEQGEDQLKKIHVIVIAHGENVATNMVKVVNKLLGAKHVTGIDMNLEDKPSDILEKAIDACKKADEGKGILLMVDMGSLKTFGSEIRKRTGINVITIDNLSMPSLLEASHKSMMPYASLKDVALAVIETNKALLINTANEITDKEKVQKIIFTTCSTGKGTAAYLKKLISKALKENCIKNVEIFEININDKNEALEKMKRLAVSKVIAAVAGSINPDIPNVPFISLMDFVSGNGLQKIISLFSSNQVINLENIKNDKTMVYDAISNALDENLRFLSGSKIMPYINKYINDIENQKNISFDNHMYTLLAIHIGYAIERLEFDQKHNENCNLTDNSLSQTIYHDFGIIFDDDEISNINIIIREGLKN